MRRPLTGDWTDMAEKIVFLKDIWALAKPYWKSEERYKSGLLLAVIVALNLGSVYLSVQFNQWYKTFYNSLQAKDYAVFLHQIWIFCGLAALFIFGAVYQVYLRQMLEIRWRRWLTDRAVSRWLGARAYYRLQIGGSSTDNPDQRIADDIGSFINRTLILGLGLLHSIVTLASFATILYGLSGSLELWGVSIPGYMLWVAVVYAAVGTVLAHLIGRPLIHLNFQQQQREADFRYALVRIRENADGIALYGGELVEAATLSERFHRIIDNWKSIMLAQKRLTWFTAGYSQVAMIFPILVGAPRYFSGAIELGGLMQISSAFGQVQNALSWFVEAYASLAEWKATVDRLATFEAAVRNAHDAPDTVGVRSEGDAGAIIAQGVELHLPNGAVLARDVRLDIEPGARMLISGPSGCGKSTLFRAIAGIWPHWQGSLTIPKGDKVLFLPQMPYLPLGTLAQAVAYPDRPDAHGLAALADALNTVGLGTLVSRLDESGNWAQTLSPGEQQRVAFARALLVRPQWLFLDEATSALDESAEAALYKALLERLPATAVISIAHRATVKAFHEDQPVIDWALQPT